MMSIWTSFLVLKSLSNECIAVTHGVSPELFPDHVFLLFNPWQSMGKVLPGVTTNLTRFYTHFSACSLPVMSLRLLICLLSPVFREKCWKCHSPTLTDARVRSLDSHAWMMMCVLSLSRYLSCWKTLNKIPHTEQEEKQVAFFGQQIWSGWGTFVWRSLSPFLHLHWLGWLSVKSRPKQPLWCHFPPFLATPK